MKRSAKVWMLVLSVLVINVCCCACENKEPQPVSLFKGEIELQTEQFIKYDDALLLFNDPFMAAIAATQTGEMIETPDLSGDITALRVSFPQRDLPMEEFLGSRLYAETPIHQPFYGYCANGVWHDYPAQDYKLKALSHDLSWMDGSTDIDHVVKIGSYLLIGLTANYLIENVTVEDSLNSKVLVFNFNDESTDKKNLHYFFIEANLSLIDENYSYFCYELPDYYFVAVEYETLPENYSISITKEFSNGPRTTTYSYVDIMTALAREQDSII